MVETRMGIAYSFGALSCISNSQAVANVVALGETVTPDLGGTSSTEAVGEAVVAALS